MKKVASEDYKKQLKSLHDTDGNFGIGSVTSKHYPYIDNVLQKMGYSSVLDYGCGKGHFIQHLKKKFPAVDVKGFDVASEEYNVLTKSKSDLVVSLDVMEHVEFGSLPNVLAEIRDHCGHVFICSVANYPAAKKLPDGRNAHVTQLPFSQWFMLFSSFFRVDKFVRTGKGEGLFICAPLVENADWR